MKTTYFISGYVDRGLIFHRIVRYQKVLEDIISEAEENMLYTVEDKTNNKILARDISLEELKGLSLNLSPDTPPESMIVYITPGIETDSDYELSSLMFDDNMARYKQFINQDDFIYKDCSELFNYTPEEWRKIIAEGLLFINTKGEKYLVRNTPGACEIRFENGTLYKGDNLRIKDSLPPEVECRLLETHKKEPIRLEGVPYVANLLLKKQK